MSRAHLTRRKRQPTWDAEDNELLSGGRATKVTADYVAGLTDGEDIYVALQHVERMGSSDQITLSDRQVSIFKLP